MNVFSSFLLVLLSAILLSMSSSASAGDGAGGVAPADSAVQGAQAESASAPPATEDEALPEESGAEEEGEGKSASVRKYYLPPTMENLSKMYWALGMFDLEKDDVAVDNYIMINECQIYQSYFTDDFEWQNIRDATRRYIARNVSDFPKRFEFIQQIELGRYSEDTQTFEVLTEQVTKGSRVFYGDVNPRNTSICEKKGNVEGYPRNVIVSLSRPIHYPRIPVNSDLARDYIARTKMNNEEDYRDLPEHLRYTVKRAAYQRAAFLVIKVRIIKFIEMRRVREGDFPVFFSALEGVEIYEDPKKKRLLYSSIARTKENKAE